MKEVYLVATIPELNLPAEFAVETHRRDLAEFIRLSNLGYRRTEVRPFGDRYPIILYTDPYMVGEGAFPVEGAAG